ncbi:MAG: Hsp20/alpha crystallin family protein [Chitinophagales bacterium]
MQFNEENYYDQEELEQYNIHAPATNVSQKYKDDEYDYMDDDSTDTTTDSEVLIPAQDTVEDVFVSTNDDFFEVHIAVKGIAQKNIRINTDKYYLNVSISPKVGAKGTSSFSHAFRLPPNANTRGGVATKYVKGNLVLSVKLNKPS